MKCEDNLLESVFATVSKSKLRSSRPGPRPVWPGWRRAELVTTESDDGTIPLTIQSALIRLRSAITLLFTPHIYYLPAVATYIWVKPASSAANYSVTTHSGWSWGGPGAKRSRGGVLHGSVDVRCKPGISLALRLPFYRNSLRNGSYLLNFVPTFLQTEMETANSFLTPYLEREILRIKFKIDSLVPANMPLLLRYWL